MFKRKRLQSQKDWKFQTLFQLVLAVDCLRQTFQNVKSYLGLRKQWKWFNFVSLLLLNLLFLVTMGNFAQNSKIQCRQCFHNLKQQCNYYFLVLLFCFHNLILNFLHLNSFTPTRTLISSRESSTAVPILSRRVNMILEISFLKILFYTFEYTIPSQLLTVLFLLLEEPLNYKLLDYLKVFAFFWEILVHVIILPCTSVHILTYKCNYFNNKLK